MLEDVTKSTCAMEEVTLNDLLLNITLVGVINGPAVCSLLDKVLLETTDDVDATELAMVNAMTLDVMGVVEMPSELYESSTELIDVLIEVSNGAVVCTSYKDDIVNTVGLLVVGGSELGTSSVAELDDNLLTVNTSVTPVVSTTDD